MFINVKHYINHHDLALAAQALSEERKRISKKSILEKTREIFWIHGEEAHEREVEYKDHIISWECAIELVEKHFGKAQ